jgi:hypothetical protein
MELTIELNKTRKTANVVFADRRDFGFLSAWRNTLGDDPNPIRNEAVTLAQLALFRYQEHSAILPYARSIDDIGDHIATNPKSEVACFVLLKCGWFPDSEVLGICHFRRTWSNNIILDYLAAHPFIARLPSAYPHEIHGVGVALLYFLSLVAKRYNCGAIWGEATQTSFSFYNHVMKLESAEDLIFVPQAKFLEFLNRPGIKQVETIDAMATTNSALEQVYAIETTNPPFVGSKTAVFNPARRLAYRFLDLPDHVQTGIAQTLGLLQNDDKCQPSAEQFRRFFRRATANGKLPNLWHKNPFPSPQEGRN